MQQFTHIVKSKMGMHMRPAIEIFHLAHRHKSNIQMTCNGKTLHAKMVMDVVHLSARQGDEILFQITGEDEEEVTTLLKAFCRKAL